MNLLGINRGHATLFFVFFLSQFTARCHGQAALDYMDMETSTLAPLQDPTASYKGQTALDYMDMKTSTLSPPQDPTASCKGDRNCETQIQQADSDTQRTGLCSSPPVFLFAKLKEEFLEQTVFPNGAVVSYECQIGYEPVPGAKQFAICMDDGKWSSPDMFCKPNFCGPPPRLEYGLPKEEFTERAMFPKGAQIRYNCRPGYIRIPSTSSIITCTADATWSLPGIFCQRKACGNPGDVNNGVMHGESFEFGSRVTYVCNPGYKMISKRNYRDCQADGKWSNALPECEVLSCPPPPEITDGHYYPEKGEYTYLDSVKYMCRGRLALIGEQTISCTEEGKWSSYAPECKVVQCPNPNVDNAIKISGFSGPHNLNSAVRFTCNARYMLVGADTVICNKNSEWEPQLPKCLSTCRNILHFQYAELAEPTTDNTFPEGTTLRLRCKQGFEPVPGAINTVTCLRFQWLTEKTFCKPIKCVEPESVPHGRIISGSFTYGDRIAYTCDTGYNIKHRYRECRADGSWSLPIPECEVQTCAAPASINHGWYDPQKEKYIYNDTITYHCDEGFQLDGQSSITCLQNGLWNYRIPVCRGICNAPPDLHHAQWPTHLKTRDTFFSGTRIQYRCNPGYYQDHRFTDTVICLANFTWSHLSNDFCQRISCGRPPKLANAVFEAENYLFESEAVYKCEKGFKMVSQSNSFKCGVNGKWNGSQPVCEVQKCSPPQDLKDGSYSIKKDEYIYNDSVTYKCNILQLVGKATVSCSDDGKWTSGVPQCKAVCTFPPELDFAVVEEEFINQEFFDTGKVVQYKCRPGFVPVTGKSNKLTCLNDLKWSKHELFCTRISCDDPGTIDHGKMQHEDFLFGSRVNYTCNPGYSMITKRNYRECQADGTWSHKPPVCKEPVCEHIWELQEEARKCTSTPDEWIKYLQVQYLYLQIENLKLDLEIKKRQLDLPFGKSSLLHK